LKKRTALLPHQVLQLSKGVIDNLSTIKEYRDAETLSTYVSFNNEVDTHALIRANLKSKIIVVPFYTETDKLRLSKLKKWSDLQEGKYGILTPRCDTIKAYEVSKVEAHLVPGIVFDSCRRRIGYGKGYYDRLLSTSTGIKIALAYDFQILDTIPSERYDIPMDIVVTEKRIITG
jgi:5-formyltetrahydrofolate cyclo-ligase